MESPLLKSHTSCNLTLERMDSFPLGTSSVNTAGSDWQGADGRQCQAELRPDHRVQD